MLNKIQFNSIQFFPVSDEYQQRYYVIKVNFAKQHWGRKVKVARIHEKTAMEIMCNFSMNLLHSIQCTRVSFFLDCKS